MRRTKFNSVSELRFDEKRALEVFQVCERVWREGQGFFAGLKSPQQRYTPEEIRENPLELSHWFFTVSIPMRGGINSEDAFRFMRLLYRQNPPLFAPESLVEIPSGDIIRAIRHTAGFQNSGSGSRGQKRAGTLSYKLEEHIQAWKQNAVVLLKQWKGDIRQVFEGTRSFEEAFRRIDSSKQNPARFVGMRRKIFSLLATWLQEFDLIHKFQLPLIVDFHVMRVLLEQEILLPQWVELGPGKSSRPERQRPETLWSYKAVKVTESVVNQVIAWSLEFLAAHNLSAHDVSHGLWFLSRELCASYYGNRSFSKKTGNKAGVTQRLVKPDMLVAIGGWPARYRDPCWFCPLEQTCAISIPAGPYYDWGVMVNAGPHVHYPGRHPLLPGVDWQAMPVRFRNSKNRRS